MDKAFQSLLSNVWRRMICNICYRASNPSMHCAWLGPSFEVCNTVIPPVVVKKRVVPMPQQAPRPLDDLHERKPSQAVISANLLAFGPPPRESPLPHSPNVGRSAHAPLAQVTQLRHPRPFTHASRRSFPLHRCHTHLHVTDRPRLHHFHPPHTKQIAFLFRPSYSITDESNPPRMSH